MHPFKISAEHRALPETRVPPPGFTARRRTAWTGLWIILLGFGLVVWHVSSGRAEPPKGRLATAAVMIKNFDFAPSAVTISPGGSVRWINADVANHQISSGAVEGNQPRPDGRVSSPLLFRGDEFTATFQTPGAYPYYCGVHPFMRGTIVVK